jgi:hypothetical protein
VVIYFYAILHINARHGSESPAGVHYLGRREPDVIRIHTPPQSTGSLFRQLLKPMAQSLLQIFNHSGSYTALIAFRIPEIIASGFGGQPGT